MHSTSSKINPTTRPRPKHQRTETLRPFIQKYPYQQLPLPELCPLTDADAPTEQPTPDLGNQPCETPCRKNS